MIINCLPLYLKLPVLSVLSVLSEMTFQIDLTILKCAHHAKMCCANSNNILHTFFKRPFSMIWFLEISRKSGSDFFFRISLFLTLKSFDSEGHHQSNKINKKNESVLRFGLAATFTLVIQGKRLTKSFN